MNQRWFLDQQKHNTIATATLYNAADLVQKNNTNALEGAVQMIAIVVPLRFVRKFTSLSIYHSRRRALPQRGELNKTRLIKTV